LHQVGRGYTDLLSALLAVGVQAAELQIWKEVDGIFTADPRKVPTARLISIISPEEAAELTYYGSDVVHPFAMEQAIRKKIPIRIKNVENPGGGGTVIHPDPEVDPAEVQEGLGTKSVPEPAPLSLLKWLSHPLVNHEHKRVPTAVTIKDNIIVVNVNSNRKSVSHGFLAGIFSTLDRFGIVVDLVSMSEVQVSMAFEDKLEKKPFERLVSDLRKSGTVRYLLAKPYFFCYSFLSRFPYTVTWLSSPSSESRCAIWSGSPGECSHHSQMKTSTLK
jgi:aspartate kinase